MYNNNKSSKHLKMEQTQTATTDSDSSNTSSLFKMKTYRYKFDNDITDELSYFAKIHQYDDRHSFKEAWEKWIADPNIKSKIDAEIQRLIENGAEGDIMDKLYKSSRYYYRKKSTTQTEAKDRKIYIRFSESILKVMDNHILEQCKQHIISSNINNQSVKMIDISPAEAYEQFCENKKDEISKEVQLLLNKSNCKTEDRGDSWMEISNKFKKTYKNRYNIIRSKNEIEL